MAMVGDGINDSRPEAAGQEALRPPRDSRPEGSGSESRSDPDPDPGKALPVARVLSGGAAENAAAVQVGLWIDWNQEFPFGLGMGPRKISSATIGVSS